VHDVPPKIVFSLLLLAEPLGEFLPDIFQVLPFGMKLNDPHGNFINPLLRVGSVTVALAQ
jgi:hypothetical protein